jgi:hypothetical protein
MKFIAVILLVLFAINFTEGRDSVVAVSGDNTHYRAYEADWFPGIDPRILELKGVEIAEKDAHDITLDAVDFVITNYNQTTLAFSYFHEEANLKNLSNPNDISDLTAAAFAFYIRAYIAYEYIELNGIEGFQYNSTDNITGYYDLSSLALPWKPMEIDTFNVTDDSGQTFRVWSITMQTLDEVFLMRFLVAGTTVEVNGVKIDSDTMKIDFEVRWFTDKHVRAAWTTGPSNPTQFPHAQVGFAVFALAEAAEVEIQENHGNETENPSVSLNAGEFVGFFSWEPTADVTVSGVVAAQAATANIAQSGEFAEVGEAAVARVIFFSFNGYRPDLVSWDPEVGAAIPYNSTVSTTGAKENSAFSIVPAFFLVSLLISLLF